MCQVRVAGDEVRGEPVQLEVRERTVVRRHPVRLTTRLATNTGQPNREVSAKCVVFNDNYITNISPADPLQLRCDITYDFALHSSLSVVWVLSNKAGSRQVAPLHCCRPSLHCSVFRLAGTERAASRPGRTG